MKLNVTVQDNTVSVEYNLTDNEKKMLQHLKEQNYLEFRDQIGGTDSTNRFKREETDELLNYGFIDHDYDAWHTTFVLTPLGKQVIQSEL